MLRAEQWMMLAVGGLGIYAVYRLTRTKPNSATPTGKGEPVAEPTELPPFPQDRPPGEPLRPKQWFHGRLDLPTHLLPMPSPPPLHPLQLTTARATREVIGQELDKLGFTNVVVYMTPDEAAPHILLPAALANPITGTRWFTAQWPANAPVRPIQRPPHMTYLWFTLPPTRAATAAVAAVGEASPGGGAREAPPSGGAIHLNPYYRPVWPQQRRA